MKVIIDGYQCDDDGTLATEALDNAVMVIVHQLPQPGELHTRMFTIGMRSDTIVGIERALEELVANLQNSDAYKEAALFVNFEQVQKTEMQCHLISEKPNAESQQ